MCEKVIELLIGTREVAPGSAIDDRRPRALLHAVAVARETLAAAKAASTIDFVTGAVEQGEGDRVLVLRRRDAGSWRRNSPALAVLLTGKTPAGQRQALVDRFQQDEGVRVFLGNIIAAGSDQSDGGYTGRLQRSDWVPANHRQAEDRAY